MRPPRRSRSSSWPLITSRAILTIKYHEILDKPVMGDAKKKQKSKNTTRKPKTISAQLAFEIERTDKAILSEAGQIEESKEGVEHGTFGQVSVPSDVVKYLLKLAEDNKKRFGLEVQITEARLRIAAGQDELVAGMLAGGETGALEEIQDLMQDDNNVKAFIDTLGTTDSQPAKSASSSSTSGGSSQEWKTERTKKLKAVLVKWLEENRPGEANFLSSATALHHKISQATLTKMLTLLHQTSYEDEGVAEMWAFIETVKKLTHVNKPEDALHNWTANLEIGPENRAKGDNPWSGFDANSSGGKATPRTEQLQIVSTLITSAEKGSDVKWATVAELLNAVLTQHKQLTAGQGRKAEDFAEPVLSQWTRTKQGWTREKH